MHYPSRWRGALALEPIPDASVSIGQRIGLSNADIAQANSMYRCQGKISLSGVVRFLVSACHGRVGFFVVIN